MPNEVHIKTILDGTDTIKGMVQQRKELKALFDAQKVYSKEYYETGRQIEQLENRLHSARRTAYGDQGKIKEAYFNSGAAMRQFYMEQRVGDRTMRESASTVKMFANAFGVGGLSTGLETAIGAFQQTEFAINGMGIAAESAGGKAGKMGASLMNMGVAAIAPLAALAAQVMIIKSSIDATSAAVNRYRAAAIKAGLLSERKEAIKELQSARGMAQGFDAGLLADLFGANPLIAGFFRLEGANDLLAKRMEARAKLQPGQIIDEATGLSTVGTVLDEVTSTGTRGGAANPLAGRGGRIGAMTMRGLPGFKTSVTAGDRIKMGVQGTDLAEVNTQIEGINANVLTIGNTLATSLTEGFTRGFAEGQNMLQTFAQSVLASIMGIAAQQTAILGISGILSLIPGVGAFGAIAGAMGSMFFNTSSGASASPISGMDVTNGRSGVVGELRGVKNAVQNLSLRVDNQGIYMASVRGEAAFTRA